jgi:hypothetical protein
VVLHLVLVVSLATAAAAQEVAESARAAEADLSYEHAVDLWLDVLAEPDIDDELKFEAHVRLASLHRILGDEGEARSHFRWVLTRQPDFRLPPDAPRKVQAYLELVREEMPPAPPPAAPSISGPEAAAPAEAPPGGDPKGIEQQRARSIAPAWVIAGGTTALMGVGLALGAPFFLAVGNDFETRALDEGTQVARAQLYDERDAAFVMANVTGAGAILFGAAAIGCFFLAFGGES